MRNVRNTRLYRNSRRLHESSWFVDLKPFGLKSKAIVTYYDCATGDVRGDFDRIEITYGIYKTKLVFSSYKDEDYVLDVELKPDLVFSDFYFDSEYSEIESLIRKCCGRKYNFDYINDMVDHILASFK